MCMFYMRQCTTLLSCPTFLDQKSAREWPLACYHATFARLPSQSGAHTDYALTHTLTLFPFFPSPALFPVISHPQRHVSAIPGIRGSATPRTFPVEAH
jgi:hypothetical protein